MEVLHKLFVFVERMKKIGIELELASNFPWIYIESVNGNRIQEEDYFHANHGYTIAFHPIRNDQKFEFLDIERTFKLIRKYKNK